MSARETRAWHQLAALQKALHQAARERVVEEGDDPDAEDGPLWDIDQNQLFFAPRGAGIHVAYSGEVDEEVFDRVAECLVQRDVASSLVSLELGGPDEGANGTREWVLSKLAKSPARFPKLRRFFVAPTKPEDHNQSLIVRSDLIMAEGGDIARLVAKMPKLVELTVPNAPDASFFEVPLERLEYVRIGSAFDTQGFIGNLARSERLPSLHIVDFAESGQWHAEWADARSQHLVTPFADYEALFASALMARVHTFVLRNTCLTLEQLAALEGRLRPERKGALQFQVIQDTRGGYVSHMRANVFPWRHLIQTDPGAQ